MEAVEPSRKSDDDAGAAVDSFETVISTFTAGKGTRRNPEMG